jgi:hypothetical protein
VDARDKRGHDDGACNSVTSERAVNTSFDLRKRVGFSGFGQIASRRGDGCPWRLTKP